MGGYQSYKDNRKPINLDNRGNYLWEYSLVTWSSGVVYCVLALCTPCNIYFQLCIWNPIVLLFLLFGQNQTLGPILFLFHFVLLDLLPDLIHFLGLNLYHAQVLIYILDQVLLLLL